MLLDVQVVVAGWPHRQQQGERHTKVQHWQQLQQRLPSTTEAYQGEEVHRCYAGGSITQQQRNA